jgi:hypothetical protein
MRTTAGQFSLCGEGLTIGYDGGDRVSTDYPHRFDFVNGESSRSSSTSAAAPTPTPKPNSPHSWRATEAARSFQAPTGLWHSDVPSRSIAGQLWRAHPSDAHPVSAGRRHSRLCKRLHVGQCQRQLVVRRLVRCLRVDRPGTAAAEERRPWYATICGSENAVESTPRQAPNPKLLSHQSPKRLTR